MKCTCCGLATVVTVVNKLTTSVFAKTVFQLGGLLSDFLGLHTFAVSFATTIALKGQLSAGLP